MPKKNINSKKKQKIGKTTVSLKGANIQIHSKEYFFHFK